MRRTLRVSCRLRKSTSLATATRSLGRVQLNVVRLDLLCELSSSQLRHLQLRLVVRKNGRNLFDNQILEPKKTRKRRTLQSLHTINFVFLGAKLQRFHELQ